MTMLLEALTVRPEVASTTVHGRLKGRAVGRDNSIERCFTAAVLGGVPLEEGGIGLVYRLGSTSRAASDCSMEGY